MAQKNGFIQCNVVSETERQKIKRNGDNILEREEATPILDSSEKTIDLDKRLRNISKLLVLGVLGVSEGSPTPWGIGEIEYPLGIQSIRDKWMLEFRITSLLEYRK